MYSTAASVAGRKRATAAGRPQRSKMATTTTAVPRESDEFQAQAERWVADFTEGWRAPKGPDTFVEHFSSRLAPDVRLVQPQLPPVVGLHGFEQRFVRTLFELEPDIHGYVGCVAAG